MNTGNMGIFPAAIRDTSHLEALLSEPTVGVVETLSRLPGDLLVLGAAGKMGPSLARMAQFFGERMGKRPILEGEEAPTALLSNGQRLLAYTGNPHIPVQSLLSWIADWVMRGGESLGKPTHFEARDGKF